MIFDSALGHTVVLTPSAGVGLAAWLGAVIPPTIMVLTLLYSIFALYFLLRDKWWRQREHSTKNRGTTAGSNGGSVPDSETLGG